MRFHYAGEYNQDENSLPRREPMPADAVPFREAESAEKLGLVANVAAGVIGVVLFAALFLRCGSAAFGWRPLVAGTALALLAMVPHEFLHALCFRGDVYMYQALSQGLLFVVGPEDMTLARFCTMSLTPATVLGVIPFAVCMACPELTTLGVFGAVSLASAAGDFYNVFNAVTQMPRGALTFLSGFHSYWYLPEKAA